MKEELRLKIIKGENSSIRREWKLGKYLYSGMTDNGFPFIAWENPNFGSLHVGKSVTGEEPKSKLRNDSSSAINVNSYGEAKQSAERMSKQIVH